MVQIGEIETPPTIPESQLCVTNTWSSTIYITYLKISQHPRWPQTNLVGLNSGQNTAHAVLRAGRTPTNAYLKTQLTGTPPMHNLDSMSHVPHMSTGFIQ